MRSLAGNRSIVIKKVDKGSCIGAWDRNDYLRERHKNNLKIRTRTEKQLLRTKCFLSWLAAVIVF